MINKTSTITYMWKVFRKNSLCKHKIDGIVYTKTNSSQIYQKPGTESKINKGYQYKKKNQAHFTQLLFNPGSHLNLTRTKFAIQNGINQSCRINTF